MEDFIYWGHPTAVGIRVEEVSGGEGSPTKAWLPMARQIFSENGKDGIYREIGHTEAGAPVLEDSDRRISVTHTPGLLAVAILPPAPEADLTEFSPSTALGIDAERKDRVQVLKIRDRFLSAKELEMIPKDDVEANIIAWTAKEAVYKALLSEGIDFREAIRIERMPELAEYPLEKKLAGRVSATRPATETAESDSAPLTTEIEFELFSYRSEEFIVTLAYTRKTVKEPGKNR